MAPAADPESPEELLKDRADFVAFCLDTAVEGGTISDADTNGELQPWFRPGFIKDTAAPVIRELIERIRQLEARVRHAEGAA